MWMPAIAIAPGGIGDMKIFRILTIFILSCAAAFAQQRGELRVTVYPQMPNVGQSAQYVIHFINVDGADTLQVETPSVDGLQFNPTPFRQQSVQSINFQTTREIRLAWNFVPRREGVFEIPAREIVIGSQRTIIPAVTFRVAPPDETLRDAFFLELELPDRPLYPGERLAVPLHLYARTDFPTRLQSPPVRSGEAFLQEELNHQFQSSRVRRNGLEYNRATWTVILSPLRSGEHPLSFSMSIAYENPRTPRSRDIFGMPQGRVEELLLSTPDQLIQVSEFPREGRPAHFRGAVGSFQLESRMDSTALQVGEPVSLYITISGQGNLESIQAPLLQNAENWRQYPPRVRTERSDTTSPSGQRIFEIILMPESESITHAPDLAFAYFNPATTSWQELRSGGEPVTVQPAARSDSPALWDFTQGDARAARATADQQRLRGPLSHPGNWTSWIQFERSTQLSSLLTLPVGGSALLGLVAWGLWLRRRKREDAERQRLEQALTKSEQWLRQAEAAEKADSALDYWRSVRAALQVACARLDSLQDRPASSLTSKDMLDILIQAKAPEDCQQSLQQWTAAAEQAEYSGNSAQLDQSLFTSRDARTLLNRIMQLP